MTDLETEPAGSGDVIVCTGNRVAIRAGFKTPADREQLRTAVEHVLRQAAGDDAAVVIDVSDSGYLDTATLTMLIGLARRCQEFLRHLAIEGANAETLHALEASGIKRVLEARGARIAGAS